MVRKFKVRVNSSPSDEEQRGIRSLTVYKRKKWRESSDDLIEDCLAFSN